MLKKSGDIGPLVSIVIPAYNSEETIKRCLESVLKQSLTQIEIITVDDGSTDSTPDIINSYKDSRIKYHRIKNGGVSRARNYGIKRSHGEYIAFLDSDDYYSSDFLNRMYDEMGSSDISVARCAVNHVYDNKIITEKMQPKIKIYHAPETYRLFFQGDKTIKCLVSALLIKRTLIMKNNIYFDENLSMMEDVLFYKDIINAAKDIAIINAPLFNYVQNPKSVTHSGEKDKKIILDILQVYKRMLRDKYIDKTELALKYTRIINHFLFRLPFSDTVELCGNNDYIEIVQDAKQNSKKNIREKLLFRSILNKNKISLRAIYNICALRRVMHV